MTRLATTSQDPGFTLLELLAVIATTSLLALVLAPALAGTRTNSKSAQCLNNLRSLTGAWQMYTSDNGDLFPTKLVANGVDWGGSNPDNTNTAKLLDSTQSPIARYVQSADLFKCPADNYLGPAGQFQGPRILSVSGNAIFGNTVSFASPSQILGRTYVSKFSKLTELNKPGPANTFMLLDEHPDSIDDSLFHFPAGYSVGNAMWQSLPGSQHDGAAGISFSDGHTILKRWQDVRITPPVRYTKYPVSVPLPLPGCPDYSWLNERMPYQ